MVIDVFDVIDVIDVIDQFGMCDDQFGMCDGNVKCNESFLFVVVITLIQRWLIDRRTHYS